ncbi:MAG: hypothetical protein LQ339_002591 [Xanthoria mediterranea]|nr:MAG: hypothetical protein LQ339_002591 [Xanthoria mediterranea]
MGVTKSEFPLLNAAGLYVVDTAGNGNCLFHALSDQLYGDQSQHGGIRDATIQYMRANGDYYKSFVEAHPGGGTRRNPKRKNAGAFASKFNNQAASPAELDAAFESHLSRMAKGGTYGDNMEVVAFSKAYNVDLIIYKSEHAFCVKVDETSAAPRMLHIAYHTYEHYSSVRNVRGPHTGIPNTEPIYESVEAAAEAKEQLAKGPYIAPWMIDAVITSQPYLSDRMIIQKKLENAGGSVDTVVSNLIEAQQASSSPSSEYGSSSIEREQDSEDDEVVGPKKKQDRRLSRASRAAAKEKEEQRKHAVTVRMKDRQLPSTKESASPPVISVDDVELHDSDETEEEDWRNESSYKDSESASVSTSASDYSASSKPPSGGVRLKLSQPKKAEDRLQLPAKGNKQRIMAAAEHTPNPLNHARIPPRRRRLFRRDELDMKKAAQKANAKDRKKASAALARASDNVRPYNPGFKEHTPAVEARIKVLCI